MSSPVDDYFESVLKLIRTLNDTGCDREAALLKDGFDGLNGLTDGWAGLLESLDLVAKSKSLSPEQKSVAKKLGDDAYSAVYRRRR